MTNQTKHTKELREKELKSIRELAWFGLTHLSLEGTKKVQLENLMARIEIAIDAIVEKAITSREDQLIEEVVNLSDKIELEGQTTLEEWKAFKRFRNTLRDKYSLKRKDK